GRGGGRDVPDRSLRNRRPAEMKDVSFRDAIDADSEALIALIGGVFDEYPGCVMDVDGEMPELRAIASHFRRLEGRFLVAEREGRVIGCVGFAPLQNSGV